MGLALLLQGIAETIKSALVLYADQESAT